MSERRIQFLLEHGSCCCWSFAKIPAFLLGKVSKLAKDVDIIVHRWRRGSAKSSNTRSSQFVAPSIMYLQYNMLTIVRSSYAFNLSGASACSWPEDWNFSFYDSIVFLPFLLRDLHCSRFFTRRCIICKIKFMCHGLNLGELLLGYRNIRAMDDETR